MRNALADIAKKEGIEDTPTAMFTYLIDRVRANLHVVLGMSPVGENFRSVCYLGHLYFLFLLVLTLSNRNVDELYEF